MRLRNFIASTTIAISVVGLAGPAAATGVAVADPCLASIEEIETSAAYETMTAGEEVQGGFYACNGPLTSLEPAGAGETYGHLEHNITSGETVDATDEALSNKNQADSSAERVPLQEPEAAATNADGVGAFTRTINTAYRETFSWQIKYGYYGNEWPKFQSTIQNTLILSLGRRQSQSVSLTWTNLQNREITPQSSTWLYLENGRFPADYIDGITIGSGRGIDYSYRTSYTDSSTLIGMENGNNYSIEQNGYYWYDLVAETGGHFFQLFGTLGRGHRWACVSDRVCQFPDGEEAPILE